MEDGGNGLCTQNGNVTSYFSEEDNRGGASSTICNFIEAHFQTRKCARTRE
jgi:hypothetical protein